MRLVDSHCHLNADRFEGDADLVIGGARLAGVERILVPGWNVASSERALALVDRFPWLDAAVGVHPHDAAKVDDAAWAGLAALRADDRVVAIGETGLDYDRVFSPIADQLANLRRNLALALETGKPAILHCRSADGRRDAQDALLEELRAAGVGDARWAAAFGDRPPAIIHSYSGPLDYGREVIDLGLAVELLGPRLPARRGGLGRGRGARPARSRARGDRFAVPGATRRAALAQRTGVGPRHSGMARGAPRRHARRSSGPSLVAAYDRALPEPSEESHEPTPRPAARVARGATLVAGRARRRRLHAGRRRRRASPPESPGLAVGVPTATDRRRARRPRPSPRPRPSSPSPTATRPRRRSADLPVVEPQEGPLRRTG